MTPLDQLAANKEASYILNLIDVEVRNGGSIDLTSWEAIRIVAARLYGTGGVLDPTPDPDSLRDAMDRHPAGKGLER